MKLKLKIYIKILVRIKKCFVLAESKFYSAESKFYYGSNKLLFGKMKNETGGAAIKEFVGLKPKMYLFLVDDSSEHKKAKRVNKNFVATINHGEYKDILSIEKCFRHPMNRIESKDHRIGSYEINKISLSCFDDKIYIKNIGYDGLALSY